VKVWPDELVLEPIVSSRTTEISVSAGTTSGLGRGGASFFAGVAALSEAEAGEEDEGSVEAV
jgi:hypothetical protein